MRPLPWSHSTLDKFGTCEHQYAEIKVYGHAVDVPGEAATWGAWVHTQIEEHFLVDPPLTWHANMLPYVPHIDSALAWAGDGDKYFEYEMAIDTKLQPTAFAGDDAWGRGIADVLVIRGAEAWAIDWKTGKMKPDSKQLKRFALFIFYHFPEIVTVHTSFEWLQSRMETRADFTLLDVQDLWRELIPELTLYKNAFKTETWRKKPSGLCRGWCPVESCEHWSPKR
jgi:hypothetical protein